MKKFVLYIGDKNYSSWSFRVWAVLKLIGIEFNEIKIALYKPESSKELAKFSPSGKVPCLHHGDIVVWDTIAIIEYLNELFPKAGLYPEDRASRSIARSCMAEMHSGFLNLRSECPMNIKRNEFKSVSEVAANDLKRVYEIFDYCKGRSGSDTFLLGDFGAIDIFFTPIISRIMSYGLDRGKYDDYIHRVLNHKFFKEWSEEAVKEISGVDYVRGVNSV